MPRFALLLLLSCAQIACREPVTEPDHPLADGTYILTHFRGLPLPDTAGEIPSVDGRHTGCYLVYTTGELHVDHDFELFNYWYEQRDTCMNRVTARFHTAGYIEQKGSRLLFRADPELGNPVQWRGEVVADEVRFVRDPGLHRFRKFN